MKLFIEPNDVLFFRDGRPFDAGGDHIARLQFPPNPVTFYGAVRAALIGQLGSFQEFRNESANPQLKEVVGYVVKKGPSGEQTTEAIAGSLRISDFGIVTWRDGQGSRLFPVPLDIALHKESGMYFILNPEKVDSKKRKMNLPHSDLCVLTSPDATDKILETPSGFLTQDGLNVYLSNEQLTSKHFVAVSKVFEREYRVGIERSTKTMTAEEGQLYSIEFARLAANVGFCVEVTGMNGVEETFKQHKLLRLGGESRSARYQEASWNSLTVPPVTNGRFKLILLTSAIFTTGWLPDGIDAASLKGTIAGCSVTLIAAAVGRPVGIGGWDIVGKKSKPMRRAVPAGSVYYLECTDKSATPSTEPNGFIHIGEEQYTKQGLGQAIIGTWNYIGEQ